MPYGVGKPLSAKTVSITTLDLNIGTQRPPKVLLPNNIPAPLPVAPFPDLKAETIEAARLRRAKISEERNTLARRLISSFQEARESQQRYLKDQEEVFEVDQEIRKLDEVIKRLSAEEQIEEHEDGNDGESEADGKDGSEDGSSEGQVHDDSLLHDTSSDV